MDGTSSTSRTTSLLARRAASLVLAASALIFAAPASADPGVDFAPGSAPVAAAQQIATDYWQSTPCAGQVSIVWMGLTDTTNATSTWTNPVSQYDAPDQNATCQIAFNDTLTWDWTKFCSVLVHEYGHLDGHPHSDSPTDVMYAFYEAPVAQCVAAAGAQPAAPAAVVATPVADILPALKAAPSAQPRAVTAGHPVHRGVLVVVREPRRHHRHRAQRGRHHRSHGHHAHRGVPVRA